MLYPEMSFFKYWNLLISVALIYVCVLMPYSMAFIDENPTWMDIMFYGADVIFLLDMSIIFFTAYYDEQGALVQDRKKIALSYLKFWFWMDLISIFPFDLIFENLQSSKINTIS